MITIRNPILLRLLGWGRYRGARRKKMPSSVTASPGLWWRWAWEMQQ